MPLSLMGMSIPACSAKPTLFDIRTLSTPSAVTLLPGFVDTPFNRGFETQMAGRAGLEAYIATSIPMKRFGTPEEFADACAYLCSAQAGFISGQNLQLDGGSYEGVF